MGFPRRSALIVFGIVFSKTNAWGQQTVAPSAASTAPETVVVTGTRTPERAQRAVVRTEVVTREEAERRGALTVADALASQPGVQVNPGAYGNLGYVSAIQIQGFDLGRVLLLEDGEPVVGDVGGAIDLASMPLGDLQRIEVVTGPSSALYGTSALGGVVQLLSGPPARQGLQASARAEGRSYRGVYAQGQGAWREQDHWVVADGSWSRQDGLGRWPDRPDLQVPDVARGMVGLRGGTKLSDAVSLRIRTRFLGQTSRGLSSQVVPGLGLALLEQPADSQRLAVQVIETIDLGNDCSLRLALARQDNFMDTATRPPGSPVGEVRARAHRMSSFETVATLADGPRTWVVGLRVQAERYAQELTKTESQTNGLTTRTVNEVLPQVFGSGALYGQLQWRFGSKVSILPGLRGEVDSRYGGAVTPRLALLVRPHGTLQVRASVGQGYRSPSAKELGFAFDHGIYGYRVLGAGTLKPETSWGTTADVTWQPTEAFRLRGGGFANWVQNLIDLDLGAGVATTTGVDYRYSNVGRARTLGAQVDGALQAHEFVRIEGGYDYLFARDDQNQRPLSGKPPHTVTLAVRLQPHKRVEVYGRGRWVSETFVAENPKSPAYATVDLRAGVDVMPKVQLYGGVLNLLDAHQDPGRPGDFRPPQGRVVYAGLRGNWPWETDE